MSETTKEPLPISPDLLEILRDPLAVQDKETYGDDPGRLELVHNCWLVSKDTGYKYPIKDGIPVMLIEEGAKWKDVDVNDLPVPPPPLIPDAPAATQSDAVAAANSSAGGAPNKLVYIVPLVIALILVWLIWQYASRRSEAEN